MPTRCFHCSFFVIRLLKGVLQDAKWGIALICFLLFGNVTMAAPLHVPNHFLSIQEAVDAAVPGDTVIVASGTYKLHSGNITIEKDNITIKSAYGPKRTIIEGKCGTPIFFFKENIGGRVEGFTIRLMNVDTKVALTGGGIYCGPSSSPVIKNNIIQGNRAVFGGGIYCDLASSPTITQNVFIENKASRHGGAIFSNDAPIDVLNNNIQRNEASHLGGAFFCRKNAPKLINNIIWDNRANAGGGVACDRASSVVINNTIVGNGATFGGGIFFEGGAVRIINTILWENKDDFYATRLGATSRPDHSDIKDGDFRGISGNISADPAFISAEEGNFRLKKTSPCINAGNDNLIYDDVDGTRNDMGAFGGPRGELTPLF